MGRSDKSYADELIEVKEQRIGRKLTRTEKIELLKNNTNWNIKKITEMYSNPVSADTIHSYNKLKRKSSATLRSIIRGLEAERFQSAGDKSDLSAAKQILRERGKKKPKRRKSRKATPVKWGKRKTRKTKITRMRTRKNPTKRVDHYIDGASDARRGLPPQSRHVDYMLGYNAAKLNMSRAKKNPVTVVRKNPYEAFAIVGYFWHTAETKFYWTGVNWTNRKSSASQYRYSAEAWREAKQYRKSWASIYPQLRHVKVERL